MYCQNCGSKCAEGVRFCEKCGSALMNDASVTKEENNVEAEKKAAGIQMDVNNQSVDIHSGLELNEQAKQGVGESMKLITSRYANAFGYDRILNTVIFEEDCLKIETKPKKKNPCPVLNYKEITSVTLTKKWFPINIIGSVIFGVSAGVTTGMGTGPLGVLLGIAVMVGFLLLWKNTQINIFTGSGGKVVLYSNSKSQAETFVSILSKFTEMQK